MHNSYLYIELSLPEILFRNLIKTLPISGPCRIKVRILFSLSLSMISYKIIMIRFRKLFSDTVSLFQLEIRFDSW